jgi:hypothetical protein
LEFIDIDAVCVGSGYVLMFNTRPGDAPSVASSYIRVGKRL